jgi:nitroreductase
MMEKRAKTEYPTHELLCSRWSPRAFTKQIPSKDQLLSLFEAARWAPSCYNDQPWFFIIATKENIKEFEVMLSCLVEQNQVWAQHVPVLVIGIARTVFALNGKINHYAFHDLGMAIQNMALQATAMGLAVHPMAGFSKSCIRKTYNIPEEYDPMTAIAIGYPGTPDELPELLKQEELEPRERKRVREFVFTRAWGKKFTD